MASYIIAIYITIFIIAGTIIRNIGDGYDSTEKKVAVSTISVLVATVFSAIIAPATTNYTYEPVDRNNCEFAKTSETLFVECGSFDVTTSRHYIYENYTDSTKVGVYYEKEHNDLMGHVYTSLSLKRKE